MVLVLLGCSNDFALQGPGGKPGTSASRDSDSGDGNPDTMETGDTTVTDPEADPCASSSATVFDLPVDGEASPYAARLVDDLDGGGAPDVLYERWKGERGVSWVRGEDLASGVADERAWLRSQAESAQAAFDIGLLGDVDADGLPDVVVAQGDGSTESLFSVHSPLWPDAVIARFSVAGTSTVALVADEPGPDLDGDGLRELPLVGPVTDSVYVFDGADTTGGEHRPEDARISVAAELEWSDRPVIGPDLDGDGVEELVLTHSARDTSYDLRVLLSGDAPAGVLDAADLPLLVDTGAKAPLLIDVDDDGYFELFVTSQTGDGRVFGFPGVAVAAAAGGTPLAIDGATVRVEAGDDEYLGIHIDPVTDDACLPALAISAHFASRVYLVDNARLVAGGVIDAGRQTVLRGSRWFGYTQDGGRDLDGDGTLDLIAGGGDGSPFQLFLAPFASGEAPP